MSLPAKPSGAATGAAAGPSSGSASSSLLPPKPSGLPDRPPVSWGPGRGGRDDDDREEGEEPDLPPSRPPRRRGGRGRRGPPPDSRRGRSPSFDRDRDDRFYGRGPPPGGRYDPYLDDRRGPPPRGRPRSRSPSPSRSFRSGRSWSRSRSRSPPRRGPPPGYGAPSRRPYMDSPPMRRRQFSRSPPPFRRRADSRSLSPPPRRRFGEPPSPDYPDRGPRRSFGGRGRSPSFSPPPGGRGRFRSPSPPPSRGERGRRRLSVSRSPPPLPPSHAPFTTRPIAKREAMPDDDDDDDVLLRKARRTSYAASAASSASRALPPQSAAMDDSLRRHVSRSPMSPSPPPPRARSPGPYSSRRSMSPPPRRRFRSPSPVRAYSPPPSRYGSRGESPQDPLPPAPPTGPRGFRPITAQASDPSPGGSANAIPTGPRNRYPGLAGRSGVPPRGPSGKGGAPPTGPSSMSAIPTGPKAWRSGQTSIAPPVASSRGGGSSHPRDDEWDAQLAPADRAESGTPPLPAELERPPMTAEEVAARAAEVERATAERDAKAQALIAQRKAQEEEQTKLLEARREENLRAREAARAQHEIDARRRRLSRFLPRSAGGILAGVQGISSESMISPGTSFEAEIIRIRRERLGQMSTYHAQLQASRKVDAALTSALAEVAAARERTKLANGEVLPTAAMPMAVGASGGY